jgi:hypothetical protein
MKHLLLLLSIFALLTLSNTVYAQTASDYFMPLTVGNYLNLHTTNIPIYSTWGARTTRHYIDRTDGIHGMTYFRYVGVEIEDNSPQDTSTFQVFWLRKDSVGNLLAGAAIVSGISKGLDSAMIIYPAWPWFVNEYFTPGYSRFMGDNYRRDSVISVSESVVTPAGQFSNCVEICSMNLDSTGKVILRDYAWYARGIGIVQEMRDIPVNYTHTSQLMTFRTVVSVRDDQSQFKPNTFSLEQNYPNPFNPSTTISYSIAKPGNVKISVYDITGSKVATIVNENKSVGNYSVQFGGSNLASGIYLYRLESGSYSASKKFILIK